MTKRSRDRILDPDKNRTKKVVVVAQLLEQLLPTPEVRSSNSAIGKIYIEHLMPTILEFEKTDIKEKRGRDWPIFKNRIKNNIIFLNFR